MRAKILLLVALVYFTSGLQLLVSALPQEHLKLDPSIQAHLELFTPTQIAWIFMGLGILGVLAVLLKKPAWGYFPVMAVSTFWGLLYLVSWYDTGYWRSVFGTITYILIVGVLLVGSKTSELPKFFKNRVDK